MRKCSKYFAKRKKKLSLKLSTSYAKITFAI